MDGLELNCFKEKSSLGLNTIVVSTPPTPGQLLIFRLYAHFLTSLELKQVDLGLCVFQPELLITNSRKKQQEALRIKGWGLVIRGWELLDS